MFDPGEVKLPLAGGGCVKPGAAGVKGSTQDMGSREKLLAVTSFDFYVGLRGVSCHRVISASQLIWRDI